MKTIELNDQQVDFIIEITRDIAYNPFTSETTKAIAEGIIKKLKEE